MKAGYRGRDHRIMVLQGTLKPQSRTAFRSKAAAFWEVYRILLFPSNHPAVGRTTWYQAGIAIPHVGHFLISRRSTHAFSASGET